MIDRRSVLRGALALGCGVGGWAVAAGPVMAQVSPARIERLAATALSPWEGGSRDGLAAVGAMNPEYDLMSRTFLAMALGDLALGDPGRWRQRAVAALDAVIADTDERCRSGGQDTFLLGYGRGWQQPSLFVDGERLMVLQIRRLLRDDPALAVRARALADAVAERMASTPTRSWPSYPDECWTFCNTLALAALRAVDLTDGTDHADLCASFAASARARVDPDTGMLVSGYTLAGRAVQGPEGSSIWASAHFLRLVDPALAAEQYALARLLLGRVVFGFGYAREWPEQVSGVEDVDSGPIVPGFEASPSSSGLAILAARSFGDRRYANALLAALELAGMPRDDGTTLRYQASNAVGDAVILAGLTVGPLWRALGAPEV